MFFYLYFLKSNFLLWFSDDLAVNVGSVETEEDDFFDDEVDDIYYDNCDTNIADSDSYMDNEAFSRSLLSSESEGDDEFEKELIIDEDTFESPKKTDEVSTTEPSKPSKNSKSPKTPKSSKPPKPSKRKTNSKAVMKKIAESFR